MFTVGDKIRIKENFTSFLGSLRVFEVTKVDSLGIILEMVLIHKEYDDDYVVVGRVYMPPAITLDYQNLIYHIIEKGKPASVRKHHRLTKIFV